METSALGTARVPGTSVHLNLRFRSEGWTGGQWRYFWTGALGLPYTGKSPAPLLSAAAPPTGVPSMKDTLPARASMPFRNTGANLS